MRYVITTPEPRWTGEVAGVAFAHGRGVTDDDPPARVIAYFLRRGYGVEPVEAAPAGENADSPQSAPDEKKIPSRRGGATSKETP